MINKKFASLLVTGALITTMGTTSALAATVSHPFCTINNCTQTGEHYHINCGVADCTQTGEHHHTNCGVANCTQTGDHQHYRGGHGRHGGGHRSGRHHC